MRDNEFYKGRYTPYDSEEDDFLNTLYDYIRRRGIKDDNKEGHILNRKYIVFSNSQVRINRSLFKADLSLLNALEELPQEGIEDVLRMVFDTLLFRDLRHQGYSEDLENKDFILIDDLDSVDNNTKDRSEGRKN